MKIIYVYVIIALTALHSPCWSAVNVNAPNDGQLPVSKELIRALSNNDLEKINSIVAERPAVDALNHAVFLAESVKALQIFIAHGVDINIRDKDGRTLLHAAALSGNFESTKFLVEAGISVDRKDFFGQTALFFAVGTNDIRAAKFLIEKGASVDAQTSTGETILMRAIEAWNYDACKLLLSSGAETRIRDVEGRTALQRLEIQLKDMVNRESDWVHFADAKGGSLGRVRNESDWYLHSQKEALVLIKAALIEEEAKRK